MLIRGSRLIGCPVQSLHLGGPIARTEEEIVDPDKLKVVGYRVTGPDVGGENGDILEMRSVREFSDLGMIIDSIDDLVAQTDVIKLDKIMRLNFFLPGLRVETARGVKLGRVVDYMVNLENWQVQQLIVQKPFLKSLMESELLIGRSQIVEVTDDKIVVKDGEVGAEDKAKDFVPNFVNPFRTTPAAPTTAESD